MTNLLINKYEPKYLKDFNYEEDYNDYINNISNNTNLNILLVGNMGSGKTVIGRSLSKSINYNFYDLDKFIDLIKKSSKPIFYTGGGVINSGTGASQLLRELVKGTNFPITSTLMGLGCYPASGSNWLGMLGMHGTYEANMAMHEADLIFALGSRFDDRTTNNPQKYSLNAKKIHLDCDYGSIEKIINVDVSLNGDAKKILNQILNKIDPKNIDKASIDLWNNEILNWRETHGLNHDLLDKKFHQKQILPQQVIQSLYKSTNGKAFITSDVGQHQMFAAQYYKFDEPRKWINSGGLGTMGFGLPSAMGVKFAFPDEDVVCVTGEGSIQMCIQELSTCMQYGLPVKIINLNNRALGMVKQWQDMQYGGRYSSILYEDSLPDFVKLAESYGHVGMKVEDISELEERMDECISMKDKLVFMDVYVDPDEHVYPMLEAGGNMSEMRVSKTKKTF